MTTDELQNRIDDAKVEGWKLSSEEGEHRAIMKKPDYGSTGAHVLIFILLGWWSLGLANILYAAKRYWMNSDTRVIRVDQ